MSHPNPELGRRRWQWWQWDARCVDVVCIRHSSARGRLAAGLVSAWVFRFVVATPVAPKCVRCPPPNHATLPTATAAAPVQLCYFRSASCVALADDLTSHSILANLLTARCSFHKAAVKTKKTKSYAYVVSIK